MSDINGFLMELRKNRGLTLREAAERSGLSHSYISSLEQGKHPRTKAPINPSPESLRGLSTAYNYPYEELMQRAGYLEEDTKRIVSNEGRDLYDQLPPEEKEAVDTLIKSILYKRRQI